MNVVLLQVPESPSLMHVHLFGAYFGLAVTSCFPEPPPGLDKNRSTPKSELFSVLGESLAAQGLQGELWGFKGSSECSQAFLLGDSGHFYLTQGHSCHTWGSVCSVSFVSSA